MSSPLPDTRAIARAHPAEGLASTLLAFAIMSIVVWAVPLPPLDAMRGTSCFSDPIIEGLMRRLSPIGHLVGAAAITGWAAIRVVRARAHLRAESAEPPVTAHGGESASDVTH